MAPLAESEQRRAGQHAGKHGGCGRGAAGRLSGIRHDRSNGERHAGGDACVPRAELHGDIARLQEKVSFISADATLVLSVKVGS